MAERQLEIADVFRVHRPRFLQYMGKSISQQQRRVIDAIISCRSAALGGHVERCDSCKHERIAYNSCRNRHCPKCQAGARAAWMAAREQELLPVPYFHVVFTFPHDLAPIALQNKSVLYRILFQAAAESLLEVAANPKHLGAKIGVMAILHTWGQNLMHHPHLHCVIPAGGVSPDGTRWVPCRRGKRGNLPFFLPVRVLSRVFRGKFIEKLKRARTHGDLVLAGKLAHLNEQRHFERLLDDAVTREWAVYAKRPFGGPLQVLKYLARYTHRVALSNHRLLNMVGNRVTFRWKDYADGNRQKSMTLDACEFMRRFLLHTLPTGFVRIRHYGFFANRNRARNLDHCRQLLDSDQQREEAKPNDGQKEICRDREVSCPACGLGRMIIVDLFPQNGLRIPRPHTTLRVSPVWDDSS